MKETMQMIAAGKLHPNPDNPRKGLGDLSELAESIKKNGIMQNLTVMPLEGRSGEYMIIMGHRRHAAAVQAGLKELPCRVVEKLARADQVGVMLAENLQRSNLTPYEEGQGFQLMLDLGETEQSISEKTGFGKTTIRHRVNIAKLDQEKLKKRQDDESFQLNITDLIALEKVPDIGRRNEILDEAKDSRDLAFLAQRAANEIKRGENLAKVIPMLEKAGVKPAPDRVAMEIYDSSKWQTVETIDLEAALPDSYRPKQAGELFYHKSYREVKIIRRAEKKKDARKPKTEAEKKRQEEESLQKKNRKRLLELAKEADAVCRDFIMGLADGKIPAAKGDDLAKAQAALWRILYETGAAMPRHGCIAFYAGKDDYYSVPEGEREEAGKWADRLGMAYQMCIAVYQSCGCTSLVDNKGAYNARAAEKVKLLYSVLRTLGLRTGRETKQILDGKHELYYTAPTEEPAMIADKAAGAGQEPKVESSAKAETQKPKAESSAKAETQKPQAESPAKAEAQKPKAESSAKAETQKPQAESPAKAETQKPQAESPAKVEALKPQAESPTKAETQKPQAESPAKVEALKPQAESPIKAETQKPKVESPVMTEVPKPKAEPSAKAQDKQQPAAKTAAA